MVEDISKRVKARNESVIRALKANSLFIHSFTNKIGYELSKYLREMCYGSLMNDCPVNMEKNTLAKVFNHLLAIDRFVQKPLNEYTQRDLCEFMQALCDGKIMRYYTRIFNAGGKTRVEVVKTQIPRKKENLKYCIREFTRFWKIYSEWQLTQVGEEEHERLRHKLAWGTQLKTPRIQRSYGDYPWHPIPHLVEAARQLVKLEYESRMLVSLNLMGRKCELDHLKFKDIIDDGGKQIIIELPNVKRFSAQKVPVTLFSFVRDRFRVYLNQCKNNKPDDYVFPSSSDAFTKNIKKVTRSYFGKDRYLTPKSLRKLGLCVAEQLNVPMPEIIRVGGWDVNSRALKHYFTRKPVDLMKYENGETNKIIAPDATVEVEHLSQQLKQESSERERLQSEMQDIKTLLVHALEARKTVHDLNPVQLRKIIEVVE